MKRNFFIILLFSLSLSANSQLHLHPVTGLPTKELYDLHIDRKGYLWIAHDLGISRYDGLSFQHFSNSQQISLSADDIVEDQKGRIWCHNFSGQIFYIENGRMELLRSYDPTSEMQYPRIAICGDELLATSDHGLFVCSTEDFHATYLPTEPRASSKPSSLAVVGNKAVLFDGQNWYVYSKATPLRKLNIDRAVQTENANTITLQPATIADALFVIANPSGIVMMLSLKQDSLILRASQKLNDYINTVSVDKRTWIHGRNESRSLDGELVVKGKGVTDVVTDKEGNTWFSSLKKGLLVNYQKPAWTLIKPPLLKREGDFIRCLNVKDGYFFAGSNNGNLYLFDSSLTKTSWRHRLFNGFGSIELIRFYRDHQFVISSSTNTYVVNPFRKKIESLLPSTAVNDVDFDDSNLYLSTFNGFYIMQALQSITMSEWLAAKQNRRSAYQQPNAKNQAYSIALKRTQAIRYDKAQQILYVAFKDGIKEISEKGVRSFLIDGKEVFVSSLAYRQPQLFIATYNDGLWIKNGEQLRHLTAKDFLLSNTIVRVKATENYLWLFEHEGLQLLNISTGKVVKDIELPNLNGANVFDVAEWKGHGYLTTADGIYKLPLVASLQQPPPAGYLDAVIVNNQDTLLTPNVTLSHRKNDLQFIFSSPSFARPEAISFKYRLVGGNETWKTTKPGERLVRYPSLPAGVYRFEEYAVARNGAVQKNIIVFDFTIKAPWWNQWWFKTLFVMIVVSIIFLFYRIRMEQLLKVERIRRSISGDLHDDIGATLSSMIIYTNLARSEKDHEYYLDLIDQNAKEVIGKLDDLVWSINPKNDTCEQLINRMRLHAEPLLNAAGIRLNFTVNPAVLQLKLDLFVKNNVYLLFKEIVNNVVKHSGAANCYINIEGTKSRFKIIVKDDGKGFEPTQVKANRNGLINMQERVRNMHGEIHVKSAVEKGTSVLVLIPISG